MPSFNLSALTPDHRALVERSLSRCDFPFDLLLPPLRQRWGRDSIAVTVENLEPHLGGTGHHHDHGDTDHPSAHPIEARGQVAGLAWSDGRIMLAPWLVPTPDLFAEVMLAECAHQVDWFFMTDAMRDAVFALFHGGDTTPHDGHGWWEERGNDDYWSLSGESWMGAFTLAYSDIVPDWMRFVHRVGPEARPAIRSILGVPAAEPPPPPVLPPPVGSAAYFGTDGSSVFHDQHSRIRQDVEWPTRELAVAAGRRPCGVCKP